MILKPGQAGNAYALVRESGGMVLTDLCDSAEHAQKLVDAYHQMTGVRFRVQPVTVVIQEREEPPEISS